MESDTLNLCPICQSIRDHTLTEEEIREGIAMIRLRHEEYEAAVTFYNLLDQVEPDEQEFRTLKTKLDTLAAPFSDNQAFIAFTERKRYLKWPEAFRKMLEKNT